MERWALQCGGVDFDVGCGSAYVAEWHVVRSEHFVDGVVIVEKSFRGKRTDALPWILGRDLLVSGRPLAQYECVALERWNALKSRKFAFAQSDGPPDLEYRAFLQVWAKCPKSAAP